MSEVTGNLNTCPRVSDIFLCKYCEHDSTCGEQLKNMTVEEREKHYNKVFTEFDEWAQNKNRRYDSSTSTKIEGENE